jgi:hypothetical protein
MPHIHGRYFGRTRGAGAVAAVVLVAPARRDGLARLEAFRLHGLDREGVPAAGPQAGCRGERRVARRSPTSSSSCSARSWASWIILPDRSTPASRPARGLRRGAHWPVPEPRVEDVERQAGDLRLRVDCGRHPLRGTIVKAKLAAASRRDAASR